MRITERIFIGTVILLSIAPALPATLRGLHEAASRAISLRTLPSDERRRSALGQPFAVAQELRDRLPEDAAVDFVMMTPQAREIAQFTGSYLAPRPCRFFDGEEAWRRRERAIWIRDMRGSNSPPAPPPGPAAAVVVIDTRQEPPIRIVR